MTRQHQQLLQKCQDISALALHIAFNAEFKPALENVTKHFVDALLLHLNDDLNEMKHIIGMQMKYDESSI